MKIERIEIPGVYVIYPRVFEDPRGYFMETYQKKRYAEFGLNVDFVQDNLSYSSQGIIRGLHYQLSNPQGKLVSVIKGEVLDVVVDIRRGSPTFGKSYSIVLNNDNKLQFYIPPGCAHGFAVLSKEAYFQYKCTDFYYPNDEYGVLWSDPNLNINWPSFKEVIISDKDAKYTVLADIPINQLPIYEE